MLMFRTVSIIILTVLDRDTEPLVDFLEFLIEVVGFVKCVILYLLLILRFSKELSEVSLAWIYFF